ncbi:tetratricopeptide repeat protein [Streptomyces celluloflavus]|uniref:tetratricopeptide repeat protein n=1 Tax=Streptomyces celluloflavus TaxID=58344 RepID=UPI0036AB99E3
MTTRHPSDPTDIARLQRLAESGDAPGVLRVLRTADGLSLRDTARITGKLATALGFDNLSEAATALVRDPEDPQYLYDFGYACVDRGAAFLAIRPLYEALRRVPDSPLARTELVAALEAENRHAEVVELLEAHLATLRPWPDRYLLAFNALLAGDPDRAGTHFARLPVPDDAQWQPAHARLHAMLRRTLALRAAATPHPFDSIAAFGGRLASDSSAATSDAPPAPAPLAPDDLRGWHFALTGGILTTLSPYGFASMRGRYGLLQETPGGVLHGLHRLRLVLARAGLRPRTVSLLPDRSSRILGRAAARLLGVPAEPFDPGRARTLVVAHRLDDADPDTLRQLRDRTDQQILFEHATCWTRPPAVGADISTLLGQFVSAPWSARLRFSGDGAAQGPPDDRPEQVIVDDLLRADPTPDPGDGESPADLDTALGRFVTTARDEWLTGPRDHLPSPGPVHSPRLT